MPLLKAKNISGSFISCSHALLDFAIKLQEKRIFCSKSLKSNISPDSHLSGVFPNVGRNRFF